MDRIESVREVVDEILLHITDHVERRCAYVHLYGVAQACALLAKKRGDNAELAVIAGMLHDIYSYATMDTSDHAHKSAEMAREILISLGLFTAAEMDLICTAICNHSDKGIVNGVLDEILKDADVMQHVLYHPLVPVKDSEKGRLVALVKEFELLDVAKDSVERFV